MYFNLPAALTLFIFLLISCYSSHLKDKNAKVFAKFPEEKQIVLKDEYKVDKIAVDGIMLYRDSLVILRNAANTSSFHFSILNLKNNTAITSCLPSNRKTGSSLAFLSYGITDNKIWVDDIIKNRIISGNIDSILTDKSYTFSEQPMSLFYYSIQLMSNSQAIASGDYDADYKIGMYDLSNDRLTDQLLPYTTDSAHPVARGAKTAYESFLFLKPGSKDKCVMACRYADRIEVADIPTKHSKVTKGPENYDPKLSLAMGGDGKQLSVRSSETRYAFVKGKVTDKYIYLLYSGNNHESKFLNYGKSVYVYDWEGNPVKKLDLNNYVVDFAVSNDDKMLYTYNPKSRYIQSSML